MSLIKCPECGKDVSDTIEKCIHCGVKLHQEQDESINKNENKYTEKIDLSVFLGLISIGMLVIIISIFDGSSLDSVIRIITPFVLIIGVCMIRKKIIIKCPKCNEEIVIQEDKENKINDNEYSYKCPKCNQEFIINKKEKTFRINEIKGNNTTNSKSNKIEELYNLKVKGIITEEEFECKKKELLSKM